jgi:hypothetical protein
MLSLLLPDLVSTLHAAAPDEGKIFEMPQDGIKQYTDIQMEGRVP